MQGFRAAYGLPGCLGAIDGSLIPLKKPTKAQVTQDANSYFGYKGGIASLLLAVCDADLQFTYGSAGAPACVCQLQIDRSIHQSIHDDHKVVLSCCASVVGSFLQVYERACLSGTIHSVTSWEPRFLFVFVHL
jgi:hypothetical protein